MSDFAEGEVVRYWQKSGGWRFGRFVRVVHARTTKHGMKGPDRGLIQHGASTVEVPLNDLKTWTKSENP